VVLLPPPPPVILPPAPVVVYSGVARCEYVAGVDYDVFYVDNCFYTHHNHQWFCTPRPGVAWVVVQPAYIPPILVPGPPPPGWNRAAVVGSPRTVTSFRDDHPFPVPDAAKSAVQSRGDKAATPVTSPSSRGRIERPAKDISPAQPAVRGGSAQPSPRTAVEKPKSPTEPTPKLTPTPKPTPPATGASRPKSGRAPGARSK
jgi:hypothetical protein